MLNTSQVVYSKAWIASMVESMKDDDAQSLQVLTGPLAPPSLLFRRELIASAIKKGPLKIKPGDPAQRKWAHVAHHLQGYQDWLASRLQPIPQKKRKN